MGLFANAGASVLGRFANRDLVLPAASVTLISMAVGSVVLLGVGMAVQGLPELSLRSWAIVAWPAAGVILAAEVAATRAAVRPDVSGLRAAGGSAGRRSARSGEGCR